MGKIKRGAIVIDPSHLVKALSPETENQVLCCPVSRRTLEHPINIIALPAAAVMCWA